MISTKTSSLPHLLICDDDSLFHLTIKEVLKESFTIRSAYNGDEAVAILKKNKMEIVLLDVQMRDPQEGLNYIGKIKAADSEVSIIMSSGLTDFDTVREALRRGVNDYVSKASCLEELPLLLAQTMEMRNLCRRKGQQNFELVKNQEKNQLVGASQAMERLRSLLNKYKNGNANVLIQGETGTGKEVFARQLRSILEDGTLAPFVSIDSSTIQSSMAESILFGHEKGAFTGAERASKGIFEEAHGGIVYFDEIGNMSLDIQAKLLRVLQEKEVVRLGSTRPIHLEFRVVCATNKNLEKEAAEGRFKDDLLQRINVLPALIPPLRERKEDIAMLLAHFAKVHSIQGKILEFSPDALDLLHAYSWPGNIRELGNLVSYLATMIEGDVVRADDLPLKITEPSMKQLCAQSGERGFYPRISRFEADLLREEYTKANGNISQMAQELGLGKSSLYAKLQEHKIHSKNK